MRDFIPARGTPLRRRDACRSGPECGVIRSTRPVSRHSFGRRPPVRTSWRAHFGPSKKTASKARGTLMARREAVIPPPSRAWAPFWQAQSRRAPRAAPSRQRAERHQTFTNELSRRRIAHSSSGRMPLTWSGARPQLFKADIEQSHPCGPETSEFLRAADR